MRLVLPRLLPAVLLAAVLVLGATSGVASPPRVDTVPAAADASTSWSVVPGDEAGVPDGRRWVELALRPGDTVTEHMVITNQGADAVEFRLTAADGYFTDTGRFTMLPSDRRSTGAGTWITLPPSIDIGGGETRSVAFTLTVPDDATPGDHPAGVAASIITGAGGQVGVESRVGFRVMTRVDGPLTPQASTSTEVTYARSWNPFRAGTMTVTYTVANTGNTRLSANPTVEVAGPFGVLPERRDGEVITDLAPGESRTSTMTFATWPLGVSTVDVRARPAVVAVDGDAPVVPPSAAMTTVLVLPVSQAVVLAVLALLVALWIRERRVRDRRVARLLEEAREEGRVQGGTAVGTTTGDAADLTTP